LPHHLLEYQLNVKPLIISLTVTPFNHFTQGTQREARYTGWFFAIRDTVLQFYNMIAMIGAAKATCGLANLHGYFKQGVLCMQGAMCGSVGIYSVR
jgi:hypothetical protein